MSSKKMTQILFIVYLIILTWIILFKFSFSLAELPQLRNINLIPFSQSVITNGQLDSTEIFYNLLVFVPVSMYLFFLKKDWQPWQIIGFSFALSLSYEVLQYLFGIGASDITDLLMNTAGGVIGLGLAWLLDRCLPNKGLTVLNTLAGLCTVLLLTLFLILFSMNG